MATERIEITLDGRKLMVEPGRTILEVAEGQGIRIPTLCNDRRLEPFASCWVCLVKVERAKGFVPSCGTKVAPGMVISTSAPDVLAARKMALELLLSNHYGDCKAPCTLTCPSTIDIQGYLGLAANGKFPEAIALIRRDNPMPAVIGRICPRPCESQCRRNLVDEPLNINGLKRFAADLEASSGPLPPREPAPRLGKRVAVVGAGPAGLSAAWYLSEKGVDVTLFESLEKAGGMLRYGIPDYRLPPAVLDRAIADILSLGATLKTGVTLGKDITLEKLRADNDAVVLAVGAWRGRALRIPGEDHPAVLSGIDFLRDVNAGKPVKVGARVAVIGGGNTALDAARCALRAGAREVSMLYRRTREEMPASDAEIEETLEEGIVIRYLAAPVSIETEGDRLKTLTLLRMELGEPDSSGRRRPVPVEGSEYAVPVDTVISAVGQYPDTRALTVDGLVDSRGNLAGSPETGVTPVAGIFAAGDLLTGADIAIRAIAGGKHAARSILSVFEGKTPGRAAEFLSKKGDFREPKAEDFADTPRAPRAKPKVAAPETRKRNYAEIESTLGREQAVAEAARCLECGCQDLRECRLKEFATDYDAMAKRYLGEVATHPIDESHPFISRDPSKCILCGRCVRMCLEVQGIGVFGYIYRGFSAVVAPSFGVPFGEDASCISCGQCVSSCPVGALSEKLPARKNVPLEETVEEGYCSLCSVCCGLEFRSHGSLFTRVTERYEAPANGKLCKKGKFGHAFLNDPVPATPAGADGAPLTPSQARDAAARMLASAKRPRMRISPLICGEAIDAFLEAAARRGIPVEAAGLADLDPGWAGVEGGSGSRFFADGEKPSADTVCILVGDVAGPNNVAFTEAFRMKRSGLVDLWIVGHDDEPARRAASRVMPELGSLAQVLAEALAKGKRVEVLTNPEEIHRAAGSAGEKAVLAALGSTAAQGSLRVTLLWNSRNGGYLFTRTAGMPRPKAGSDLVLEVGAEDGAGSAGGVANRVVWGRRASGSALFVPLPHDLWIRGTSHPSGRESLKVGSVDEDAIRELALMV